MVYGIYISSTLGQHSTIVYKKDAKDYEMDLQAIFTVFLMLFSVYKLSTGKGVTLQGNACRSSEMSTIADTSKLQSLYAPSLITCGSLCHNHANCVSYIFASNVCSLYSSSLETGAAVPSKKQLCGSNKPPILPSVPCDSVIVLLDSWLEGWKGQVRVPITVSISSWNFSVTFNVPVSTMEIWRAAASTRDNTTFTWVSLSYNGVQTSGTVLAVDFLIRFPTTTTPPYVTSVVFNGVTACTG